MNNNILEHNHEHTIYSELMCHLPYAIFSVAFGLAVLSFMSSGSTEHATTSHMNDRATILFHSFHFMHIIFAVTGTLITYFRFSKNVFKAIIVGVISPSIFCMLSDAVLPYFGGRLLGGTMNFHLCFVSELNNVLPFLFVGLINGIIMSTHHASRQEIYSLFSHFLHILVSSLASIFYLVSQGLTNWYDHIGMVFLFLIIAVVVPCTLSDVVVPMLFARSGKANERH